MHVMFLLQDVATGLVARMLMDWCCFFQAFETRNLKEKDQLLEQALAASVTEGAKKAIVSARLPNQAL